MTEVWLHKNRRPLTMALIVLCVVATVDILAVLGALGNGRNTSPRIVGGAIALACAIGIVVVLWLMQRPRLAYRDGELLVYLRPGVPIRVPIAIVEGFLIGKQETKLGQRKAEVSSLAIRLSEKAAEWAMVEVHPQLGRWCGGYITIFGTWCEPLNIALVNRLNARLAEVTRQHAESRVAT